MAKQFKNLYVIAIVPLQRKQCDLSAYKQSGHFERATKVKSEQKAPHHKGYKESQDTMRKFRQPMEDIRH